MDIQNPRSIAERLYIALAAWDLPTIHAILSPDFKGRSTAGLPVGLGGSFEGPAAMIEKFWAQIGRHYEAKAVPERFLVGDDGQLVVHGTYVGRARGGGELDAAFVHLISFDGERIASLEQLTDSQKWTDALAAKSETKVEGDKDEGADRTVRFAFDEATGLATVTLNRPEARGAIDGRVARELLAIALRLTTLSDEKLLRAVLIDGNGPTFTVGGDIAVFAKAPPGGLPDLFLNIITPYHQALTLLDALAAPIVCAVSGAAAGGGLGLLHVSDIVIAAEGTKFAAGFAGLGLTGDGSSTWFLPRLIGPKRAAEFYLEKRVLTANEAAEWGLITRVVSRDALQAEALRAATNLAAGPTIAFGRVRRLLRESWDAPLAVQLTSELEAIRVAGASEDADNAVASFLAKKEPVFRGK